MIFLGGFFGRISSDFRQKELLPLKLLFFVHSSTLYVLYPYLTIHMRELGISVEETAIMSAVTPLVAIIMPPLAGLIADKIGNFKVLLSLFSGFGGAASLLLLLVPVGRMVITYPERTVVELACSQDGYAELSLVEPYPCERKGNRSTELKVQIEACGMICHKPHFAPYAEVLGPRNAEEEAISILRTRNYTVLTGSNSYEYTLSGDDVETSSKAKNTAHTRVLKTRGRFPTAVRNLSSTKYFFPTSGLFQFTCTSESCGLVQAQGVPQKILHSPKILETTVIQGRSTQNKMHSFLLESIRDSNSTKYLNYTCQEGGEESVGRVMVPLLNPDNSLEVAALLEFANCSTTCLATLPRANICSNLKVTTELNISLTFWLYLTIRVFIGMIGGTAFAMFEGAVIAILREHKADYGLQRIYATIGGMISSPLSGWLIDYASRGKDFTDYRPTFYLYAVLKIVSALLMLTINLEFKAPATNVLSDVLFVLRKAEVVALFITCFILGTAWGYIESFLFWFLEDLGASRSLMGITITVGGIAGLPLLVMSGPIIDRIGHANVLFIGFIFYAIRLVGYSLIYNPWMCLIFEAMESMTSSLAFTAAVTYAAKLSTTTTDSSIQGLLGGLYFGVGKGSGSLIGGYLMKAVGTRPTYQIFAAVTLITGCLYYLFNKFYIVARSDQKQDSGEKDPANEKGVTLEETKKQKQNGTEPKVLPPSQKSGEERNCVVRSLSDHSKVNAGFEPDVKEKR